MLKALLFPCFYWLFSFLASYSHDLSSFLVVQISEEEGRLKKDEEETKEMWKRKREHEEQWEGTREQRVCFHLSLLMSPENIFNLAQPKCKSTNCIKVLLVSLPSNQYFTNLLIYKHIGQFVDFFPYYCALHYMLAFMHFVFMIFILCSSCKRVELLSRQRMPLFLLQRMEEHELASSILHLLAMF